MLVKKSFRAIPVALLFNLLLEFCGSGLGIEAAISNNGGKPNNVKNPVVKHNHQHPSHSDFIVKYSDGTPLSAELEYQYLLPEMTIFDATDEPVASKVLLTSPPRLTIQPSHVEEFYSQESSFINKPYGVHASDGASVPISRSLKPEACVSETPAFPFVASSFPTELQTTVHYAITAGRVETASSTDSVNEMPIRIASRMSQPSTVFLQGATVSTKSLAGRSYFLFNR